MDLTETKPEKKTRKREGEEEKSEEKSDQSFSSNTRSRTFYKPNPQSPLPTTHTHTPSIFRTSHNIFLLFFLLFLEMPFLSEIKDSRGRWNQSTVNCRSRGRAVNLGQWTRGPLPVSDREEWSHQIPNRRGFPKVVKVVIEDGGKNRWIFLSSCFPPSLLLPSSSRSTIALAVGLSPTTLLSFFAFFFVIFPFSSVLSFVVLLFDLSPLCLSLGGQRR